MLNSAPEPAARALRARWAQLEVSEPHLALPEAAGRLGATPLALLEARVHDGLVPLEPNWPALAANLCAFGRVSVRSERPGCVLELCGTFGAPRCLPDALSFDGPQIALHADPRRWSGAYAFEVLTRLRTRRGLSFCDDDGELAWTLELIAGSNRRVLDAFLDVFADRREERPAPALRPLDERGHTPCATAEALALQWAASGRSASLEPLLWRNGLAYERVLRQRARGCAQALAPESVGATLELSARRGLALRVAAGGRSTLLAGRVEGRFATAGAWWNLVGEAGALHVAASAIGEVWRLHGRRTTLEVFDRERRPLLSLAEHAPLEQADSLSWSSLLLAVDGAVPSGVTRRP
jgi:putative heme degradation protein